ncbi:HAD family hydrolase [Bacillus swezeyi]|uniref:Hydrolase (Had superfamily) n=1 Tax=Bacillus swezeyi TaxID=1925020 RepID=A0A5M8RUD7_9BACI|nr:HAD family hydrolase [Bacillus swezeyi]KAA6449462.1 hydrolase (had superfamily) [Bacillus swezeyi]KAA6474234.1 hydrolase (had superfamily) [Bacillus swezeyi]TYS33478.1 hydrolase (had superfamily) [Bacillus swezeyi]
MKAFASDLDRTLIYSKKMIDAYGGEAGYQLIETLDGREISFISEKTRENLRKIHEEILFIPVTTRTTEQYKRITFFQEAVIPEYAITTNGGCILKNGSPIREWSSFIDGQLQSCMPIKDMLEEIAKLPLSQLAERVRTAHHYFVYLIFSEENVGKINASAAKAWAADKGWQASLQGRKLYFIPEPLNKWRAVDYLKSRLNIDEVYAAGDSLLDFDLIAQADYGVSPAHGEVLQHHPDLNATVRPGMKAADDITEHIVNLLIPACQRKQTIF